MTTTKQRIADELFCKEGWTKAGGMWGDAQWKQLSPGIVVSIGGGNDADSTLATDDFTQTPINLDFPCLLYIYAGPFIDGWTVEDGEAPIEDPNETLLAEVFRSAREALTFVNKLTPFLKQ